MNKSICYYTDNQLDEHIERLVRCYLSRVDIPIFSASLKPISFGLNEVINEERGYPTLVKQIISCLKRSKSKYVFFCEHDVLYPESHFDFTPPKDDVFYYNRNTWRWWLGSDKVIQHDRMYSLSTMCANREFTLDHYLRRQKVIENNGWDQIKSHEPQWARIMGYEPGTKKMRRGGFSDDDFGTWYSEVPVIDIRHHGTFSRPKTKISDFTHPPKWFREEPVDFLEDWNLKELFP